MANVGYATLQIIPSARGFGAALNGQVAPGMTASGATSGKKFGAGMLGAFKSIAGPLAAVAGTAAIGSFFKNAITGASDLQETLSKTKVIFGDATDGVVKFAEDSKRNILLTKQEALDASATFGVFGKSAGLTGKALGGFSTDLTALAGDLSSFYNTGTDEAITALGAALRGESEPIRKYGVLLDDASMRQEALRLGLIKNVKTALTPANKVLAAQSLILQKTTDAQGDAARTADGFANQTKILKKNFVDIRNEIGSAVLPAVTTLTTLLASGLKPAFETIKTAAKPVIDFFKSFGDESGKTSAKVQVFKDALKSIGASITPLIQIVGNFGRQIIAIVGPAFKDIANIITTQLAPAFAAVLPIIRPVAEFFIKIIGNAVIGALKGTINFIKGALTVITGIFNVFSGLFKGDWKKLWNGVKQIFGGFVQAVTGVFQFFWNIGILGIFRKAGVALIGAAKGAVGGLKNAFVAGLESLLTFMKGIPGRMLNIYLKLPKLFFDLGKNIMSGLINGIKSMGGTLINIIKTSITDKLPDFVKKALGIASPSKVFIEIGKNVGLGFIKGVQGTQDKIKDTFAKLAELVKKSGSKPLIKAVSEAQKTILDLAKSRDVLTEQYKDAKGALSDLKREAADYAKSVKDSIVATGNFSDARSFDAIVRNLTVSVEKAAEFNKVITGLKDAGLNNTALTQLVEAGPAGALNAAKALLASGQTGISTVNNLQAQLAKQGDSIGKTISGKIYDAAIADAEKTVKSIAKDLTKVENKIVGVAAALAKEIAKIGKIDAPSWLKDLIGVTKYTAKTASAPKSPTINSRTSSTFAGTSGNQPAVVVNNYNPIAEPTSVTVSNTLTRLALIGAYDR